MRDWGPGQAIIGNFAWLPTSFTGGWKHSSIWAEISIFSVSLVPRPVKNTKVNFEKPRPRFRRTSLVPVVNVLLRSPQLREEILVRNSPSAHDPHSLAQHFWQ